MRSAFAAGLGLWLCLSATPAAAQEPASDVCKGYIGGQWQTLGSGPMTACLKGIEQWVSEYNEQGFKFGLWGQTLLSADRYYFYQSPDGGKAWQAVGLKSELARETDAAPTLPGPGGSDVVAAVTRDAAGADAPTATAPATTAPEATAPAAAAPAPAAVEKQTAGAATPRSTASAGERRGCSLHTGREWKLIPNLTLEECAVELDRSPDTYDQNGFKYAYWSGVFLAANQQEVLKSAGSENWQLVFQRTPR